MRVPPPRILSALEVDRETDGTTMTPLLEPVHLVGGDQDQRPSRHLDFPCPEMLHTLAAQVEQGLAEAMRVLAEPVDPRQVLVQGDPAQDITGPLDREVLEQDRTKPIFHEKIDIDFVLTQPIFS